MLARSFWRLTVLCCLFLISDIFAIQQIRETFTTSSDGNILYGIGFGSNNSIMYKSSQNSDGSTIISRFQISPWGRTLLSSFQPKLRFLAFDKIFQVNNSYTIIYSTQVPSVVQIYTTKNKFVNVRQYNEGISQIIYAKGRNKVFVLKKSGDVEWMEFDSFIRPGNNVSQVLIGLNQTIQGQLSPDQRYLSLKTTDSSYLCVLQIDNKSIIYQTHQQFSPSTLITWHQNSLSLYLYDPQLSNLFFINLTDPINQKINPITLMSVPLLQKIYLMLHFNETNELLIVYRKVWEKENYYFDVFKVADWKLSYRKVVYAEFDVKDFVVSDKSVDTVYNFAMIDLEMNAKFGSLTVKKTSVPAPINPSTKPVLPVYPQKITPTINSQTKIITPVNPSKNYTNPKQQDPTPEILQQPQTSLLTNTMGNAAFRSLNKIPGSRKLLKPLFMYFSNLDDLWLYYYHQRNYDQCLQDTFKSIKNVQQQKWQLIPLQQVYQTWLNFDFQSLKLQIDQYKDKFTSMKYFQIQNHSVGFIFNSLNFFTTNLVVLMVIFIVGMTLHQLFQHLQFRIASAFKQFTLWLYFMFMCLEGNIQFFSYLLGFQINTISHSTLLEKGLTLSVLIFGFFFIFVIVTLPYLALWFYKENAQILYDNCKSSQVGIFYISLNFGLRNMFLGMIHIFLRKSYIPKIISLLSIQLIFAFTTVIYISWKKSFFYRKFNTWINVLGSCIRILIVVTFLVQPEISKNSNETVYTSLYFSQYYSTLLLCNMSLWVISMLHQIVSVLFQVKQSISSHQVETKKSAKQMEITEQRQQISAISRSINLKKNHKAIRVSRMSPNLNFIAKRLGNHGKSRFYNDGTKSHNTQKNSEDVNKIQQKNELQSQNIIQNPTLQHKKQDFTLKQLDSSALESQLVSPQQSFLSNQSQSSHIQRKNKSLVPRNSRHLKIPVHVRRSKRISQTPLKIIEASFSMQDNNF